MADKLHEYFKRNSSEWCITGFLNECKIEPFERKINQYLRCLDKIVDEKDKRKERAKVLLRAYREASHSPIQRPFAEPQNQCWSTGDPLGCLMLKGHSPSWHWTTRVQDPQTDRKKARKWEKERLRKQVIVNQPKITDINGNMIGNMGTITGGSLVVGSKREVEEDLNNKIDNFFQSPSVRQSSNLFGEVEQDISNETDNEKDEIIYRTEKHRRDESPYCLNCDAKINISIFRFCPFCGTNIVSSEDEPSLDYDDAGEENDTSDRDEEDDTPPKVDKVAYRLAYDAIPDTSKLRLSTGKIVEDVLFEFAKEMDYEHHAHSYIVDFDDEDIKALFDEEEWKELTKDPIGIPPVPHEIAKELTKYGKNTLKELRAVVMAPYLKEKEEYDVNKHYEQEWIQMALRTLCNLYENVVAPLIRSQYEDWFTVALFGTCIDFCIRDIQLGTDIKRTDAPSLSSANRKNRCRKANTRTRKLTGRKIDGIIYTVDKLFEVGAIEGARSYSGASDQKYLLETFKMPKTLRDMYADLMRAVDYDDKKANKIQVIGILHLGLWIQFARLWRAGGSICIFRKDPLSHNVDSKFSEMGVRSFLKLLVSIYQHKVRKNFLFFWLLFHFTSASYSLCFVFTDYHKGQPASPEHSEQY
ncbi:8552_t:CDS:2 [Funneliformis geosporum]|uniref:16292_t:CDS:1 n=1 Tax=Funneliformis geosporum TaxID=1117311 RepID=A0A9W4SXY8_9GLOM|nr:16292_t:CDS:2 [Funneliformis geosporum]CAI2184993.1 8552_t:CDS:2 [Funneliformis geosporum]